MPRGKGRASKKIMEMADPESATQVMVRDRAIAKLAKMKPALPPHYRTPVSANAAQLAAVTSPIFMLGGPVMAAAPFAAIGAIGALKGVEHGVKSIMRRRIEKNTLAELEDIQRRERLAAMRPLRVADIVPRASGMPRMCPNCGKTKM